MSTIKCIKCGQNISRSHVYCNYCGTFQKQPTDLQNLRFKKNIAKRNSHYPGSWKYCDKCKSYRRVKKNLASGTVAPNLPNFCWRCGKPLSYLAMDNIKEKDVLMIE